MWGTRWGFAQVKKWPGPVWASCGGN